MIDSLLVSIVTDCDDIDRHCQNLAILFEYCLIFNYKL